MKISLKNEVILWIYILMRAKLPVSSPLKKKKTKHTLVGKHSRPKAGKIKKLSRSLSKLFQCCTDILSRLDFEFASARSSKWRSVTPHLFSFLMTDWRLIKLPLLQDILIDDRYRLVRKVADGGWSTVFIGIYWLAPMYKKNKKKS